MNSTLLWHIRTALPKANWEERHPLWLVHAFIVVLMQYGNRVNRLCLFSRSQVDHRRHSTMRCSLVHLALLVD